MSPFGVKPAESKPLHLCCDICAKNCLCGGEACLEPNYGQFVIHELKRTDEKPTSMHVCRLATPEMRENIKVQLLALRAEKIQGATSLYAGHDLAGALSLPVIDSIARDCDFIESQVSLQRKYHIFCDVEKVWDIIASNTIAEEEFTAGAHALTNTDESDTESDSSAYQRGVLLSSSDTCSD